MRIGRRRGLISLGIPVRTALTRRTIEMLPALPIKNENQPGSEEGRGGPLNGKQEQLSRTIRNEDITSVKGKGKERSQLGVSISAGKGKRGHNLTNTLL